jgi:hypothetical protein
MEQKTCSAVSILFSSLENLFVMRQIRISSGQIRVRNVEALYALPVRTDALGPAVGLPDMFQFLGQNQISISWFAANDSTAGLVTASKHRIEANIFANIFISTSIR